MPADQTRAEAVMLRDGQQAVLRPADRDDLEAIDALLGGPTPADARLWVVAGPGGNGRRLLGVGGFRMPPAGRPGATLFAVAPDALGNGVGTLLLEHAIEGAAAAGIDTLSTTVPADASAIHVLRGSGATLHEQPTDGLVRVEISTRLEEPGRGRWEERSRARTAASLLPLFRPRAVAVIGASPSPGSVGGQVLRRLVEGGFNGPVYPVHPSAHSVGSVRAYPSVEDIPDQVDLAVIAVPAAVVQGVVEACSRAGVRALVVLSAGFAETGEEGRRLEAQLLHTVREHGMRMVGPNCLGVLNTDPEVALNASFGRALPAPGHVGMSSQSGAMGLVITDHAQQLGLGLSTFISVGNKADISGNDLLEYWERDPATNVIVLYLESFGNPRRFSRIARRVSRTKPILAVKSGRSAAGLRAAQSHTAALASSDIAVDALFEQSGVLRVDTLEELFNVASALTAQPLPEGRRVAVITNAGGPGILCADACEAGGLELPELSTATLEVLRAALPSTAGLANPVDMIATATPDQYELVTQQVLQDRSIDSLIALNVAVGAARADAFVRAIRRGAEGAARLTGVQKPLLACLMTPEDFPPSLRVTPGQPSAVGTIPAYRFPETPARALAQMWRYRAMRDRPPGREHVPAGADRAAARAVVDAALARGDGWLTMAECEALLRAAGIPLPRWRIAGSPDEAATVAEEFAVPVAAKVVAPGIVHKTDVGGVALGLETPGAVREACASMLRRIDAPIEGFIVQEMVRQGTEVIVGVTSDPTFGPLVAFGLGGTAVEVLGDVAFRVTPLTDVDAADMVRGIRAARLLQGHRGQPPSDLGAIEDLLMRISGSPWRTSGSWRWI